MHKYKGDHRKQLKVLDIWRELFPDSIRAKRESVEVLTIAGLDNDKAESLLLELRSLLPEEGSIIRDLTRLYIQKNELETAVTNQISYTELYPNDESGWISLSDVYIRLARFNEAKDALERVILLNDTHFSANYQKAMLEMRLGDFESSAFQFESLRPLAISLEQKVLVVQGRISLLVLQGQISSAIELFSELDLLLQNQPVLARVVGLNFMKSMLYSQIGQFESANKELNAGKKLLQAPMDQLIEMGYAMVYMLQKDAQLLDDQIKKIEALLKQYPNPMFEFALAKYASAAQRIAR